MAPSLAFGAGSGLSSPVPLSGMPLGPMGEGGGMQQTLSQDPTKGAMAPQSGDQQGLDPLLMEALMAQLMGGQSAGLGNMSLLQGVGGQSLGQFGVPFGGMGAPQQSLVGPPGQAQGTGTADPLNQVKQILGGISSLSRLANGLASPTVDQDQRGGTGGVSLSDMLRGGGSLNPPQGMALQQDIGGVDPLVADLLSRGMPMADIQELLGQQMLPPGSGPALEQISGGELGLGASLGGSVAAPGASGSALGSGGGGGTLGQGDGGGTLSQIAGGAGSAASGLSGLLSLYQGIQGGRPVNAALGGLQTGRSLYNLAGEGLLGDSAKSLAGGLSDSISGLASNITGSGAAAAGDSVSGAAGAGAGASEGAAADTAANASGAAAGSVLGAYNIASLVYSLGKLGFELGLGSGGPTSGNQYMDLAMGLLGPVGDIIGGFAQPAFMPSEQWQSFGGRLAQTLGGEKKDLQNIITALGSAKTQGDVVQDANLFKQDLGSSIGDYQLGNLNGAPQLSGLPGAGGSAHEHGIRANFDQPVGLINQYLAALYQGLPAGAATPLSLDAYNLGLTEQGLGQFNQGAQDIMATNPMLEGEDINQGRLPQGVMAMMSQYPPQVQGALMHALLPQLQQSYWQQAFAGQPVNGS